MKDRKLLKLAAKAANLGTVIFENASDDDGYDSGVWSYTWIREKSGKLLDWNPLENDGDALRLAVQCLPFHILEYTAEDYEYCNQDGFAATRRAIVRKAAEIGKDMK